MRFDHAESIENIAAHEMQRDIRLAARVCDRLAALRFEVAEIAESCMKQEPAATRRDLLDALAQASESGMSDTNVTPLHPASPVRGEE